MKKVLVIGASGLVGSRFIELSSEKYKFSCPEYPAFNLLNKKQILSCIDGEKPEVVVNFAAYTDVSKGEEQRGDQKGECWQINVQGVKNLVSATKPDIHFIQISTDMVFSGGEDDPGPYLENHQPEPQSPKVTWYGYTKGQGEKEVLQVLGKKATILRLIYPVRAKYDLKLDYLRKPLALYDQGKLYPMFKDQQISITFIDEITLALEKIIDLAKRGIFHASACDTTTPYEIISYLIEKARGKKNAVKPSSLDEFLKTVDNPVRYPKYGGLKVAETERILGIKFSPCKKIVDALIAQGLGD